MTGVSFYKRLPTLMRITLDNPPYAANTPILTKLKKLGVEPGKEFDPDPGIAKGLNRAPAEVWLKFQAGPYGDIHGEWAGEFTQPGGYGTDYNTPALIAWLGLGALTSDDAVYTSAFVEGDGNIMDGASMCWLRTGGSWIMGYPFRSRPRTR
jgi:hypothetical protein